MVIVIKIMRSKQTGKIIKFFTCYHKINESNAKVATHYWSLCLYSKNISFYIFVRNTFFNFFSNMFNSKTIKINNFTSVAKKKQTNVCLHLHIYQGLLLMLHTLFLTENYLLKKHTIKSWFIFMIPLYFKVY